MKLRRLVALHEFGQATAIMCIGMVLNIVLRIVFRDHTLPHRPPPSTWRVRRRPFRLDALSPAHACLLWIMVLSPAYRRQPTMRKVGRRSDRCTWPLRRRNGLSAGMVGVLPIARIAPRISSSLAPHLPARQHRFHRPDHDRHAFIITGVAVSRGLQLRYLQELLLQSLPSFNPQYVPSAPGDLLNIGTGTTT